MSCKICHGCSCQIDRFRPVILCADIDKAFLETCMKEIDRNYLRFHWVNGPDDVNVKTMGFTRLLFGLIQSPFGGNPKNTF